jgi:RNA polymerase sigma-70 factor (ECF subfamily)
MKSAHSRAVADHELIEAAKGGDNRAFSALVRRYEDTVYRFSLKVCQDPEKASETLQDTFINVFRKLHTFDGRSKFSTWLYTIVTNNCLMKRRRRKRDLMEESLEAFDEGPGGDHKDGHPSLARWEHTPVHAVLETELRTVLEEAIQALPPDYRVVFVLRDMEQKTTEETAEIVGISVEAAKSRLRRARAFLRSRLDPYMRAA